MKYTLTIICALLLSSSLYAQITLSSSMEECIERNSKKLINLSTDVAKKEFISALGQGVKIKFVDYFVNNLLLIYEGGGTHMDKKSTSKNDSIWTWKVYSWDTLSRKDTIIYWNSEATYRIIHDTIITWLGYAQAQWVEQNDGYAVAFETFEKLSTNQLLDHALGKKEVVILTDNDWKPHINDDNEAKKVGNNMIVFYTFGLNDIREHYYMDKYIGTTAELASED